MIGGLHVAPAEAGAAGGFLRAIPPAAPASAGAMR
jgi:hypothetical protein